MSGRLAVIGLGPGDARYLTTEAQAVLAEAEALYGYAGYLDRVPPRAGQARHASDNREESARAAAALAHAAAGARVALVSGGDPGVFAMAAAVCEAIAHGPLQWRAHELAVVPGVTAMLAVAARAGAPLGHDFCALSLSDNLKPWELIERRLDAAAKAGFVIALYNPISRARPWQLGKAFERLRVRASRARAARLHVALRKGCVPMIDPRQRIRDRLHRQHRGQRRPAQHDHGEAERAGRRDLSIGGFAAAVLRHHDLDSVRRQQRLVRGLRERSAPDDIARPRHRERRLDRVDAAHQIEMLRGGHEGGEVVAAERQKYAPRCLAERLHGGASVFYIDPMIARDRDPRRTPRGTGTN